MPKETENRIMDSNENEDEKVFDFSLRPQRLCEYIGQEKIKENLDITIEAAKKRGEPIEHTLLHGAPGLGKTTLAHVIANETGANIKITSGPAIEKSGDLAAILSNLEEGDVLFIDEIHRLNKTVEEILYPAMEDFALDIIIGKGPSARNLRIDLPKFSIIGATTKASLIAAPLRDRFGLIYHLDFYQEEDMSKIIKRSARILQIEAGDEPAAEIARRSRRTPRIANRLLKRVRDFCQVKHDGQMDFKNCRAALENLEIDELGLDQTDRKILQIIIEKFRGGPVGLNTMAATSGQDLSTIEEVYEPFLLQIGFLERTPRGRVVTPQAREHLKKYGAV